MRALPKSFSSIKFALIISFIILLIDQVTKYFVASYINTHETINVLPFLNFVFVENTGITFGILKNINNQLVFVLLNITIVLYLFFWIKRNRNFVLPGAFIISGAIGNIIDRLHNKAVIDFLDFHVANYHWPAFNIADSFIVIGCMFLFFIEYREEKKS